MPFRAWTRRSFLHAVLAGSAVAVGGLVIPDRLLARELPPGRLSFYNIHTKDRLTVTYRDDSGRYDQGALGEINHVLRCHYTGDVVPIDPAVIEFVNIVDKKLGGAHEIDVISGYRSPAYNDWLIQHGHGVARHSLHLAGKAIDLRMPGVKLATIREVALSQGYGGVGYYPASDFVHLDSGRVRTW